MYTQTRQLSKESNLEYYIYFLMQTKNATNKINLIRTSMLIIYNHRTNTVVGSILTRGMKLIYNVRNRKLKIIKKRK